MGSFGQAFSGATDQQGTISIPIKEIAHLSEDKTFDLLLGNDKSGVVDLSAIVDRERQAATAAANMAKELKDKEARERWTGLVVPLLNKCDSPRAVLKAQRSAVPDEARKFAAATCASNELNDDERAQCLQRCEAMALLARTEADSSATTMQGARATGPGDAEQRRRDAASSRTSSSARRPEPSQSEVDREAARYQRQARKFCECIGECGKTARCMELCEVPNDRTLRIAVITGCH